MRALLVSASLVVTLAGPSIASGKPVRELPPIPGWFYPGEGNDRQFVDEDGMMNGIPVIRSGVIMAEVTSADAARELRGDHGPRGVAAHDAAARRPAGASGT